MGIVPSTGGRLARLTVIGVALAVLCALFGTTASAPAATKMKLALQTPANFAPVSLGKRLGYFKKAGIDLEVVRVTSPAAIIPGLMRGDYQATTFSWTAMTVAASQGLPLVGVASLDRAGTNPKKDIQQLLVPKNSPIKTLADLKGKTIGVNATKNLGEIQIAEILRRKAKVQAKYVSVPFPNQSAALKSGQIDAVNAIEPFVTLMKQTLGVRSIAGPNVDFYPNLSIANVTMTRDYVNKNKALVQAFRRAMDKSVRYAARHPDAVRSILPTHSGIAPEVASAVTLPTFSTAISLRQLNRIAVILRNYGTIPKAPDMSKSVFTG